MRPAWEQKRWRETVRAWICPVAKLTAFEDEVDVACERKEGALDEDFVLSSWKAGFAGSRSSWFEPACPLW